MYAGRMDLLNYHHLRYFRTVAREGSVARACERLHVAQPTISAQLADFQRAIGHTLFIREGRRLRLTDVGRAVLSYADEIFSVGDELTDFLEGRLRRGPIRFTVGIADAIPKLAALRLLSPATALNDDVQLVCCEAAPNVLLARLAVHELDMVLADAPIPPDVKVRGFNHLLGECRISVFGVPRLAKAYRRGFPRSLTDAPFLLPTGESELRRAIVVWFDRNDIRVKLKGEFEDSALMKAFGGEGLGLFAAPSIIADEAKAHFGVVPVGTLPGVTQQYYAITVARRYKHPATVAVCDGARKNVFD